MHLQTNNAIVEWEHPATNCQPVNYLNINVMLNTLAQVKNIYIKHTRAN